MTRLLSVLAAFLLLCVPARADTASEIRAAYLSFAEAQNSRDPERIRAHLLGTGDLLWVSDGMTFRGPDEILARMGSFQRAEIWRVEPDLEASTVTVFHEDTALLHMPLTLVIGQATEPNRLGFLVSLLFVRDEGSWRIAALLTTRAKP